MQPTILFDTDCTNVASAILQAESADSAEPVISIPIEDNQQADIVEPSQMMPPSSKGMCKGFNRKTSGPKATATATSTASTSSNTAVQYSEMADNEPSVSQEIFYPAYLFQPPPSQLKFEDLRRHALIAKIERDRATTRFFNLCHGILGPLKDALLAISGVPRNAQNNPNDSDHNYQCATPK